MDMLVNDALLQSFLPVAVHGAVMLGGAAVAMAQCGKSREQPVKRGDRPASRRSEKSRKSSKSGKSRRSEKSGRSKKRSGSSKKIKDPKVERSSKSGRSGRSRKSSKSGKEKRRSKKSSSSSKGRSAKRSKTSDRQAKVNRSAARLAAQVAEQKDDSAKVQTPPKRAEEPVVDVAKCLHAEPRELRFSHVGGIQKLTITNPTPQKVAIKVKCSDNNLYRVNPVYGFIDASSELAVDIVRQNAPSKVDKLVLMVTKVSPSLEEAKKAFENKDNLPMIVIPLLG